MRIGASPAMKSPTAAPFGIPPANYIGTLAYSQGNHALLGIGACYREALYLS